MAVQIVINNTPPSMNRYAGRENSMEYREMKKDWTLLVQMLGRRKAPPAPYKRAVVTITYRFPTRGRRDPDNYCGKLLLDGLTAAGIIEDDSFKCIDLVLRAEREPGAKRTTITVDEIDACTKECRGKGAKYGNQD